MRLDIIRSLTTIIIYLGIVTSVFSENTSYIKTYRLSDNSVVKISHLDLTCDNVTNGGAIAGDEIGCPNPIFDPAMIVNTLLPSGGTGTLEYIWMYTLENPNKPVATWTPIPNTNSPNYDPGPLNATTYFIRCSRRTGCTLYTGETNYVTKQVKCCPGNITDGGEIGPEQISCVKPFDPSSINNVKTPTGGGGTIEYEWLVSTIGGSINNGTWAVIGGAQSNFYDPPILDKTTYFVRRARVELCNVWEYSNVVKITLTDGVSLSNSKNNPSCFQGSDGTISISVLTGESPFIYKWSNSGINNPNQNNLSAGSYSVTVTDKNGCTSKATIILTDPLELNITGSVTPTTCFGSLTGKIDISVSGGTPNYSFKWSSGETTQNILNKAAGTYIVTVTDSKSCTKSKSFTINDAPEINFTSNITHNNCFNDNKGSILLSVTGGTPGYTYLWSNGSTGNPVNNLIAGSYSVTITDTKGCKKYGNFNINNGLEIVVSGIVKDAACYNDKNGTITLTVSGGTPGYTYKWSNGSVMKDISNLGAGSYTVTITDANGCTSIKSYNVAQPNELLVTGIPSNPSCFNGSNGSVDISVTGGIMPYTYTWNGAPGIQDLNNAAAGTYTVIVTDKNGCSKSAVFVLSNPAEIQLSGVVTNTYCNKALGGVVLTVLNGSAPFTYSWSNGQSSKNLTNVSSGSYSVTVTDAKGCKKSASFQIDDNGGITLTESITNLKCFGDHTGSISISVAGGIPPYAINWSNGASNINLINNLPAGNYSVTVSDANQCIAIKSFIIIQPTEINAKAIITDVNCFGQNNGSILLTVSGGTPGYTYKWSNGSVMKDISNLGAGSYTVTITDANGCTSIKSYNVAQPNELLVTGIPSNPSCFNGSNGSVDISVTGGIMPYTYTWNGATGNQDLNNAAAGTYTVIVTDKNGCSKSAVFVLSNPAEIQLSGVVTNTYCNKSIGSVILTVMHGTAPYTYLWSNGQTSKNLVNVGFGSYLVTVTDAKGCIKSATFQIIDDGGISISETVNGLKCFGDNNGSISIVISGGKPAYSINWSNGASNINSINNLNAGNYSVTVSDINQCQAVKSFTISQPEALTVNGTATNLTCFNQNNGSVSLSVSGGTPSYTYKWSNGTSTKNLLNISEGTYTVTVTDANGCTIVKSYIVTQPNDLMITGVPTNPTCFNGLNGVIDLTVTGGTSPYTYTWNGASSNQDINNIGPGTYTVIVTDKNGCTKNSVFVLTNPSEIIISGVVKNTTCNGGKSGSIILTVTGGQPAYSYKWSNGAATKDLTAIGGGAYSVTVTDGKNCTKTANFIVSEGDNLQVTEIIDNIKCFGDKTGKITVTAIGGVMPYLYNWNNGSNSSVISNLGAGSYSVTASDASGCKAIKTYNLAEPTKLNSILTIVNITCFGSHDGMLTANATGGTMPYTYKWSNGETTQKIQNLFAGNYSVTVTDSNGCSSISNASVTSPTALTTTIKAGKTSCYNSQDATIDITVSGGTKPYSYLWSNGASTEDLTNVGKGNYTVTITDANGCKKIETISIFSPLQISFDISVQEQTCINTNDGKATVGNVQGGTPPYSYKWNNSAGSTTPMISNLAPGTYTVTVTDSKNCSEIKSVTINPSTLKCTVNIGDYVWLDEDKDGIQDDSEMGINGIVVHLIELGPDMILGTGDDVITDTDYTKNNSGKKGYYYFPDVPKGKYVVMFFIDNNVYAYSPKDQGSNDAKDSDVNPATGKTDIIMVNPGDPDNLTIDAGVYVYCENITNGGVICCDETLCSIGAVPSLIQNVVYPSGGKGNLVYMWMKSTTNPIYNPGSPDWVGIPNSNTPSYQPGPLTETTYFIRCSKREDCLTFTGESNMVTKTVVDGKQADIQNAPTILCKNELVTLNSINYGAGVIYAWTLGPGATPITATTPSVNVKWSIGGFKTVELAVTYKGCTSVDYVVINVVSCTNIADIIYFDAIINAEKKVDLTWKVKNNSDNLFEIERSQDNQNFRKISSVAGFPEKDNIYRLTDQQPEIGINYYRIKSYDAEGKYTFSETKSVVVEDPENRKIVVYPNPAYDHITIEPLIDNIKKATLEIFDVSGRIKKTIELEEGFKQFDIDIRDFVEGTYFVNIKIKGKRPLAYKIIKVD